MLGDKTIQSAVTRLVVAASSSDPVRLVRRRRLERTRRLGLARWAASAFDAAVANIPPRRSFVAARSDNVSVRADVDSAGVDDDYGRADVDSGRADYDYGRADDDSGRVDIVGDVASFVRGEEIDVSTGADGLSRGIWQAWELPLRRLEG